MEAFIALLAAAVFLFSVAWITLPDDTGFARTVAVDYLVAFAAGAIALFLLLAATLLSLPLPLIIVFTAFALLGASFSGAVFYATRQEVLAHREDKRRQFFSLNERRKEKII